MITRNWFLTCRLWRKFTPCVFSFSWAFYEPGSMIWISHQYILQTLAEYLNFFLSLVVNFSLNINLFNIIRSVTLKKKEKEDIKRKTTEGWISNGEKEGISHFFLKFCFPFLSVSPNITKIGSRNCSMNIIVSWDFMTGFDFGYLWLLRDIMHSRKREGGGEAFPILKLNIDTGYANTLLL